MKETTKVVFNPDNMEDKERSDKIWEKIRNDGWEIVIRTIGRGKRKRIYISAMK